MEVPILRIPGITYKAMLLRVFTCNCEGREYSDTTSEVPEIETEEI